MKDMPARRVVPPSPREYQGVNWEGLKTLYLREVRRFWKVGMQTLTARGHRPALHDGLRGRRGPQAGGGGRRLRAVHRAGPSDDAILGNAFSNSSSSLLQPR